MNLSTILACVVIVGAVIGIIVWMIRNVKRGRSFCGAELTEPLNTKDASQSQTAFKQSFFSGGNNHEI